MKIMTNNGTNYFIGMPIECNISLRVEGETNHSWISLSNSSGVRLDMILTEQMKKEIIKELSKNGKKERRTKE